MTSNRKSKTQAGVGLYRQLWRWHFYAGIFCIPFILTLAVSGAIYLFKPQIDAWLDHPYQNLRIEGPVASAEAQVQAALTAMPGAGLVSYELPRSPRQAVKITVTLEGRQHLLYVHPHTLEILKAIPREAQFIRQVRAFHGELLAGNTGSVLVELAACWAIVLVITGLYLWWPRGARGLAGTLYPRLRQGQRLFWRDLHGVTGVWISALMLFLLVSGLPWALVWGSAFKEVRQWGQNGHGEHKEHHEELRQDWSISAAHHQQDAQPGMERPPLVAEVIDSARALNFAPPVELSPDPERAGVWQLKSQSQNRPLRADAWLDGNTGAVLRQQAFGERKLIDRVVGIGVAAHEGQLFGWLNQLVGLLTALGLVMLAVSGAVMWWRRRPAVGLGAPPPIREERLAKTVAMIIVLLAVLLPLVGISLVILWILETSVLRWLPGGRRWLGLAA